MKTEKTSTQLLNPMPSLEEAKEMCKIYARPLQNHAIILNAVAPMVSPGGIRLNETQQGLLQQEANKNGMLVVISPFKLDADGNKDLNNISAVYEGERIIFEQNSHAAFTTVVTSNKLLEGLVLRENQIPTPEMYRKYVIMCMRVTSFTCVLAD